MKLSLIAAVFCALAVNAVPLVDIEMTSVSFDENKAALDAGRLSVHLSRVDDLVDENDSNRLLLERLTHVAIEIQMLPERGCMRVNSQDIPLFPEDDESKPSSNAALVHIAQAQSYSIPSDLPEGLFSPEGIDALTNVMSKGIVSVEIKLEREDVKVDAIGNEVAMAIVDNVKLRRIGLYIKIHEVEGVDLEHTSLVYAPVMQLLVKSDEDGNTQVTTLSIAGKSVSNPVGIPEMDLVEEEIAQILPAFRHHSHHQHDSGLWNWVQSLVGNQNEQFHRPQPHMHYGLAADTLGRARLGRPAAGAHRHHKHGACFTRRFAMGLSYVFSTMVAFFTTTLVGSMMLGLIAGGMLFSLLRRIKHCAIRQAEAEQMAEAQAFFDENKHEVYYVVEGDELPEYQEGSPLFDAEAEQKLVDEKSEKN